MRITTGVYSVASASQMVATADKAQRLLKMWTWPVTCVSVQVKGAHREAGQQLLAVCQQSSWPPGVLGPSQTGPVLLCSGAQVSLERRRNPVEAEADVLTCVSSSLVNSAEKLTEDPSTCVPSMPSECVSESLAPKVFNIMQISALWKPKRVITINHEPEGWF